jgi:hypothetical protein
MKSVSAPMSSPRKRIGTLIIDRKARLRSSARCSSSSATLRYQSSSTCGWNAVSPVVSAHRLMSPRCCGTQVVGRTIASMASSSWARAMRTTPAGPRASKKPKSPSAGRQAASVCSRVSRWLPEEQSRAAARLNTSWVAQLPDGKPFRMEDRSPGEGKWRCPRLSGPPPPADVRRVLLSFVHLSRGNLRARRRLW